MNVKKVRALHQDLFGAIESENTKESLSIIRCIISCHDSSHCDKPGSLLDRYTHRNQWPLSPLIHSLATGNADVARTLLENDCDLSIRISDRDLDSSIDHKKCIKLNYAFFFRVIGKPGFELIVLKILDANDEVLSDKTANTALHVICQNKLTSWLEMILNSPSQRKLLYYTNKYGYLPMHVAAECNFIEYFYLIFKYSFMTSNNCDDMARGVSKFDNDKTVDLNPRILLRNDDSQINSGKSAAIVGGNLMSERKVDDGKKSERACIGKYFIDLNTAIYGKGQTVLHIAAEQKNYKMVKWLVENGANVSALNFRYHSPLLACFYATKYGEADSDFINVSRSLVMAGTQVSGFSHNKKFVPKNRIVQSRDFGYVVTPLHMAADIGCKDIVELLLCNGADPKVVCKYLGKLPIQIALEKCHTECAQVLLNQTLYPKGFLMSFVDKQSNSLLHSACESDEEIVDELIMHCKSCVDKPNQFDVFPLDKAIFHGNIPLVFALLTCCPKVVNICQWRQYKTRPPLHLAASSPLTHLPLCQILLSFGSDIYAKAYNKKNMAYRTALRSDCYENAVFLCEQMSRPFKIADRAELLEYGENRMGSELLKRLKRRLDNVPSLLMHCLDVVRQALIGNCHSFQLASSLPIPGKMIRALTYQDANQCF